MGGTNRLTLKTRCLSPFTCRRSASSTGLPAWGTGIRGGSPSTWCANGAAGVGAAMTDVATGFIALGKAIWSKSHFVAICAEPATDVSPLDDGSFLVFFELGGGHRGRVIVDVFADRDIATLLSRGK